MALDACLLEAVEGGGPAALRLYRWAEPTLSLGYFQAYAQASAEHPDLAGLPIVRRETGGGAILHADELTYSLAMPLEHPLAGQRPEELYTWAHARIAEAAAALGATVGPVGEGGCSARGGPFMCFACHARFDLVAGGAKLAGSAQRRSRRGLLQHGSVVLRATHPAQPAVGVAELAGQPIDFQQMADALVDAVERAGVELTPAGTTQVDAEQLAHHRARHGDPAWIRRR